MPNTVQLGGRAVGAGAPVLIIAEAGVNHDGDVEKALALVDAAVGAGADMVKFQHFDADRLASATAPKAPYQKDTTGSLQSQHDMLASLQLTRHELALVRDHCDDRGIECLCTPYDAKSAEELVETGFRSLKVASADAVNRPFLRHLDALGVPILLSTGMCDLVEVEAAVSDLASCHERGELLLFHCVSSYPAPMDSLNLRAMQTLEAAFDVPVGFSDHTTGVETAAWAVMAGAKIVEKHLTLDRSEVGPDHRASLDPDQFGKMVRRARLAESALGDGTKEPVPAELENAAAMRRSLVMVRDRPAGSVLDEDDLAVMRPAGGVPPSRWDETIGRTIIRPLSAGHTVRDSDVDWGDHG